MTTTHLFDALGHRFELDVSASAVWISVDGHARVGLLADDEACGDPSLVVWGGEGPSDDAEAVLVAHLGRIDFGRSADEVHRALLDDCGER